MDVITDENVLGEFIPQETPTDTTSTPAATASTQTSTNMQKELEKGVKSIGTVNSRPAARSILDTLKAQMDQLTAEGNNARQIESDNIIGAYDNNRLDLAWNNFKKRNLSKEDAQYALNNMDYNNTLALSRFADAFNNRYWTTPVGIGARHHTRNGASGTDLSNVVAQSRAHRKEPITTEEMRQMEATRAVDRKRREQEQDHYNTLRTFETELLKFNAQEQINFLTFLEKMDAETQQYLMKAFTDFEYTSKNKAALEQLLYNNQLHMDAALKAKVASLLNDVSRKNPIYGQILGQPFGTVMPSQLQRITQQMITDIVDESNGNYEIALSAILHLLNAVGSSAFNTFFKNKDTAQ